MCTCEVTPHCSKPPLHNNVVNICFSVKFTFRCCLDVLKYNLFNVVNRFKNISVVAPVLSLLLLSVVFNANRWLMISKNRVSFKTQNSKDVIFIGFLMASRLKKINKTKTEN